jgi:hypothetical protein
MRVKVTHYRGRMLDKMHFACGAHAMSRNSSDIGKVTCPACRALSFNVCQRCGQHGVGPCGCGFQAEGQRP